MLRLALLGLFAPSLAFAKPLTCGDPRLPPLVKEAWEFEPAKLLCTQVRATQPLLLIEEPYDGVEGPDGGMHHVALIETASGEVRWHTHSYPGTPGSTSMWRVADLDGDGADELIEHERHQGHMGTSSQRLVVYAIAAGVPETRGEVALAFGGEARDSGQNSCSAVWALVGGGPAGTLRIQVRGKRDANPRLNQVRDECPLDGAHRYRWTGTALDRVD